ncbi:hypothetical protein FB451DRAFT_1556849 [Mycena latifolia]|nr:hypothetical protein FB451DRAFT_1556849 [Mycena latifolia]
MLSSVIDPLLEITDRIEQVSINTEGLIELAARIDVLTPIVSEMSQNKPDRARVVVEALQRELQSITMNLTNARSQNTLQKFFNSTDNASSLGKHDTTLAHLITDSTLVYVVEMYKSLRELEHSKSPAPIIPQGRQTPFIVLLALISNIGQIEMGDISGGPGGTKGRGRICGKSGVDEAPKLELSLNQGWEIGNIFSGTGGTDGEGDEVGGTGGTAKL